MNLDFFFTQLSALKIFHQWFFFFDVNSSPQARTRMNGLNLNFQLLLVCLGFSAVPSPTIMKQTNYTRAMWFSPLWFFCLHKDSPSSELFNPLQLTYTVS